MAAINETRRQPPQFCRPPVHVTHLGVRKHFGVGRYIFQKIHFSASLAMTRNLPHSHQSFSRTALALRTHPSVTTTCPSSRRDFLKKQAFAGANAAGIRDELQS